MGGRGRGGAGPDGARARPPLPARRAGGDEAGHHDGVDGGQLVDQRGLHRRYGATILHGVPGVDQKGRHVGDAPAEDRQALPAHVVPDRPGLGLPLPAVLQSGRGPDGHRGRPGRHVDPSRHPHDPPHPVGQAAAHPASLAHHQPVEGLLRPLVRGPLDDLVHLDDRLHRARTPLRGPNPGQQRRAAPTVASAAHRGADVPARRRRSWAVCGRTLA